jgi:hypothetical protein
MGTSAFFIARAEMNISKKIVPCVSNSLVNSSLAIIIHAVIKRPD